MNNFSDFGQNPQSCTGGFLSVFLVGLKNKIFLFNQMI